MNLDFLKDLENGIKNLEVKEFMKELTNFLENMGKSEGDKVANIGRDDKLNCYREENCLYQVVDMSKDGVFLQNTNNNKIFEETNISRSIRDKIGTDCILRYKNGTYVFEEELTDKFFDSLIDINEYKRIQEKFIKDSNILEIDSNMCYKVNLRGEHYTKLKYGNDFENIIDVPNVLLPYFLNEDTILYYAKGKFHKKL